MRALAGDVWRGGHADGLGCAPRWWKYIALTSGPIGHGGRIDGRFSTDRPTAARAEAGLRRLLPGPDGVRVERAWGGPIDVSADHLPFFGTVPGTNIHYGVGHSGNGVGPSVLGGEILASLAALPRLLRMQLGTR